MKRISSILREGRGAGRRGERERRERAGRRGAADAAERLRVGVGASIFPREKEEEEEEIGGGQGPSKQGGGSLTRNGVSRGPLFLPRLCSPFSLFLFVVLGASPILLAVSDIIPRAWSFVVPGQGSSPVPEQKARSAREKETGPWSSRVKYTLG